MSCICNYFVKMSLFYYMISQGFNSIPLNYLKKNYLFDILYSNHCILLFTLFMYVVLEDGRLQILMEVTWQHLFFISLRRLFYFHFNQVVQLFLKSCIRCCFHFLAHLAKRHVLYVFVIGDIHLDFILLFYDILISFYETTGSN